MAQNRIYMYLYVAFVIVIYNLPKTKATMDCQRYYTQDDRGRCIPCQDFNACVMAKDSSFAMDNCKRYCKEYAEDFLNKPAESASCGEPDFTLPIILGALLGCSIILNIVLPILCWKKRCRCHNRDIIKAPIPVSSETNPEQGEAAPLNPTENQQTVLQMQVPSALQDEDHDTGIYLNGSTPNRSSESVY